MDNTSTYPVSIEENTVDGAYAEMHLFTLFWWHSNGTKILRKYFLMVLSFEKIFLDGPVLFSFVLSRPLKICDFGGDGLMVSRGSRWLQHEDVSKLS